MNERFLNEVWTHVTTSLYAVEDWAYVDSRGDGGNIIEVREHNLESDGVPGEPFFMNRHDLEKDLRAMFDIAVERIWNGSGSHYQDWGNLFVAGIAMQDIGEWDDEVVDVFVQLSTLGEIVYG